MNDWKYIDNDRVVENGNYVVDTGATSKAARMLCSKYCKVGGLPYGNKLLLDLRVNITTTYRAQAKRWCEEALQPLVGSGEIKDVIVTVDDPAQVTSVARGTTVGMSNALAIQVQFTDVRSGTVSTVTVPAWGTP